MYVFLVSFADTIYIAPPLEDISAGSILMPKQLVGHKSHVVLSTHATKNYNNSKYLMFTLKCTKTKKLLHGKILSLQAEEVVTINGVISVLGFKILVSLANTP